MVWDFLTTVYRINIPLFSNKLFTPATVDILPTSGCISIWLPEGILVLTGQDRVGFYRGKTLSLVGQKSQNDKCFRPN